MRGMVRKILPFLALGLAGMLGGCIAYPAYPGYGYGYGYPAPYYGGAYVAGGGGYVGGGGGGWHEGGWHQN